ncbi:MAG: M48 family metallopeptidase [Sulfitobacter sp.]|nr:M48 family metallopeptidase [Sulfitobacter sp.]
MSVGFNGFGSAYFDGDRPISEEVSLHIANKNLQIGLDDGSTLFWPVNNIRILEDQADKNSFTLRLTTEPVSRLFVTDKSLLGYLPSATRRAPPKGRAKLAAWAVAAVAAVALQVTVLVPMLADRLAVFIPPAGERALGEATFEQIRNALDETGLAPLAVCENPKGVRALTQMTAALNAGEGAPEGLSVTVLDHKMINAFALPGGFVVIFKGLIDQAETPDEVAAVLAHEIGHVVSRDPTRHALRSAGSIGILGLLFGDFAGGAAVLFLTERLISATYSQQAETDADAFGYSRLEAANVSPAALGTMFGRLRDAHGEGIELLNHFLSHPSLAERIENARAAVDDTRDYAPILEEAGWADLQTICD